VTRFKLDLEYGGYDERQRVNIHTDRSFIFIRDNIKTRAPHVCEYCKRTISAGDKSTRYSGRDERIGFYCYHVCKNCT
jgi:hypothetical protein